MLPKLLVLPGDDALVKKTLGNNTPVIAPSIQVTQHIQAPPRAYRACLQQLRYHCLNEEIAGCRLEPYGPAQTTAIQCHLFSPGPLEGTHV